MKYIKAILLLSVTLALIYFLDSKQGSIPPIGKLLNPFAGFWQNAESKELLEKEINLPQLKGKVEIAFDAHAVPHIFADNEYDLYFTQGYITAKDRLWQMDFQTRFAAGRLSEVVGEKAIDSINTNVGWVWLTELKK